MIRWKRLVLVLTPLVLVWAGTHFFLDRGIRVAVEKAGTAANGARVELGGVSTRLWGLTLTLSDLQVTDAENPLTNIVQIESLRFKLAPKPLFWRKIVVEEARIAGVRTGTPRRRSGALPAPARTAAPNAPAEPGLTDFALDNIKTQYDPDRWVTLESLDSYRRLQDEKNRLAGLKDDWPERWKALDTAALAERVRAYSERVKDEKFSGLEGVKKAKEYADEGKAIKAEVDRRREALKDAREALERETAQGKRALAEIDRLKKEDIDRRMDLVRRSFTAEGVTRALVGPVWMGKIQTAVGTFHKVQKLRPSKKKGKDDAPAAKPRDGEDIAFPFHYDWPAFWLKTAAISGHTLSASDAELARLETDAGLHYAGTLRDVSSDPAKLGRPIALELNGRSAARRLRLEAALDLARDPARGTADAAFDGLDLAGTALGSVGGPVSVERGSGRLTARLATRGDEVQGAIELNAAGLRLRVGDGADSSAAARALRGALAQATQARVTFHVSGPATRPRIRVSSTLDDELNGILKNALKGELDSLENRLQGRVGALIDGDRAALSGAWASRLGPLSEKLGGREKALEELRGRLESSLREAADRGAGGGGSDLKNIKSLFKKR